MECMESTQAPSLHRGTTAPTSSSTVETRCGSGEKTIQLAPGEFDEWRQWISYYIQK